jgi:hypothetical protein
MYAPGRRDAGAEQAAAWQRITAPVVHGTPAAELEERRSGPRRPGGFPGRTASRNPSKSWRPDDLPP